MPDDFRLKWPREGCPRDPDALPPDPNGPSIFTAVEEQTRAGVADGEGSGGDAGGRTLTLASAPPARCAQECPRGTRWYPES